MTSLSLLSGRFAYATANGGGGGTVLPKKLFGAALSPIASATRNIKDEYVPSAPVSVRNTYLPLTKRAQNTVTQVPNSQSYHQDSRNAYLQANKVQQNQNTDAPKPQSDAVAAPQWFQEMTSAEIPDGRTRGSVWFPGLTSPNITEGVRGGISLRAESPAPVENSVVEESVASGGAVNLFMEYDSTGAMTVRDGDGNIVPAESMPEWRDLRGLGRQEFIDRLEENPSLAWRFDLGDGKATSINDVYKGHDILNAIFPKVYGNVRSLVDTNGGQKVLDEYGYTFSVPGALSLGGAVVYSTYFDGRPKDVIVSEQHHGLQYLTLEEHDIFYAEVQKIFDQNGVQRDARQEDYAFVPTLPEGVVYNPCSAHPLPQDYTPYKGWLWTDFGTGSFGIDQQTFLRVEEAMTANSTIQALFEKAEGVRNGTITDDTLAQNYSILVTDKDGNRLANDRIIVAAENGNQVEMSVDQFSQMSRLDITKLLR